jgi:hypothetical protein
MVKGTAMLCTYGQQKSAGFQTSEYMHGTVLIEKLPVVTVVRYI